MRITRNNIKTSTAVLLAITIFAIFYTPWMFDQFQIVPLHDNLDGEVVVNKIIGDLLSTSSRANLALNGNLPPIALSRLFQPLELIYATTSPWKAYFITDIIVRLIAFLGVLLLCREYSISPVSSTLLGLVFATSISYSVFLLTVAGIPLALWGIIKSSNIEKNHLSMVYLMLFFIGLNISLALSGLFFIASCIPLIYFGFKEKLNTKSSLALIIFLTALIIGNFNLIFSEFFSGTIWHRAEFNHFIRLDIGVASLLSEFTQPNLLEHRYWYHVSHPLPILIYSLPILFLFSSKREYIRQLFFLLSLFFITAIYIFAKSTYSIPLRSSINSLNSFQWDRFYFLYSSIITIAFLFLFKDFSKNRFKTAIIYLSLLSQLTLNLYYTPQVRAVADYLAGYPIRSKTFNEYYLPDEFELIRQKTGDSAVLSVGLSPMIAPMNNIPSIDGYYVLYPLEYKHRFRKIINDTLTPSGTKKYFDEWGNRIYAFFPSGQPELLNFCAAQELGASFVISALPITVATLRLDSIIEESKNIYLYEIRKDQCRK